MDSINPRAIVQKLDLNEDSLRIQVPFSMSISGPSQSINYYKLLLFKLKDFL